MNIVFMASGYYPNYSAVGKCVGNVVEYFPGDNNIFVIALKNNKNDLAYEEYKNHKIIRVDTLDNNIRNILKERIINSHGLKRKIYTLSHNIYRSLKALSFVLSKVSVDKSLVNAFERALVELNSRIDVIIPSSMPIETIISAVNYKSGTNNQVTVIPYLFDQFAESKTLHRLEFNRKIKMRKHIELERKLLHYSDHIFAMHSLEDHINNYIPEIKKISYVEHPLIIKAETRKILENDELKISYIGGLYKKYVSPDYLLKLFSEIDIKEAKLNFYVIGNNIKNVNRYCKIIPNKIINHGRVDKRTANEQIENSNILISIAEKSGIQMSSKIFEYMSYGKPIIHFYKNDKDVNKKILREYPLSLCIKEDEVLFNENLNKFKEFCMNNKYKRIDFDDVKKIYPDAVPTFTANQINSKIMSFKNTV